MTKREMVNYWEDMGMTFLNDTVKEGHIKFNTEEGLKNMINNWLDKFNPNARRV